MMTCQLLSKDGSSLDDAEVLTGRWQSYVASFVSVCAMVRVRRLGVYLCRFCRSLRRKTCHPRKSAAHSFDGTFVTPLHYTCMPHSCSTSNLPAEKKLPDLAARGALEIKVCVRTYRLFFVSHTEDVLWRRSEPGEYDKAMKRLEAQNERQRQWLQKRDKEEEAPSVNAPG